LMLSLFGRSRNLRTGVEATAFFLFNILARLRARLFCAALPPFVRETFTRDTNALLLVRIGSGRSERILRQLGQPAPYRAPVTRVRPCHGDLDAFRIEIRPMHLPSAKATSALELGAVPDADYCPRSFFEASVTPGTALARRCASETMSGA